MGVSGGGGAKESFPHINQLLKGKGEISNLTLKTQSTQPVSI